MSNYFGTGAISGYSGAVNVPVYEGYVAPTGDALMQIAADGVLEGAQLQAALHIADATIAYTAVHESVGAAEVVLESVIGSTVSKIKEGLKKLWAKIKAWFASIRKSVSLMFSKGKEFVNKYKKEIETKPARGFEYEGYAWSVKAGSDAFKAATDALKTQLVTIVGELDSTIEQFETKAMTAAAAGSTHTDTYETEKLHDDIVQAMKGSLDVTGSADLSDLKESLDKKYRGGKDEKEELKEFSKVTRANLIDFIKDVDKNLKVVTDNEKEVDKVFTTAIKALDKAEVGVGKKEDSSFGTGDTVTSNRAKVTTLASKMGAAVRYGQAVNSALASTAVDAVKASAAEAESVLKSFIRFKGVKEGYQQNEPNGSGVMESFMRQVQF